MHYIRRIVRRVEDERAIRCYDSSLTFEFRACKIPIASQKEEKPMRKSVNADHRLQNEVRLLRDRVSELESLLDRARGAGGRAAAGTAAHERERLVEIMESTPDLVATSTADGRILYMNRAGKRMLGMAEDADVHGVLIRTFLSPEKARTTMEVAILKAIECGSYSHDTYPRRTDGAEIPASQVTLSHKLPNGEVDFLSTIILDVTERKWVETPLAESEAKFRSIIQSSPMGVDCSRRCDA
jgi:PAS domain S-box-containing protein